MNRSSSVSRAAAIRRAASSVVLLENLELRRLLSGGYTLEHTFTDSNPTPMQQFGWSVATNGNLALIGVPEAAGPQNQDAAGKVLLVDTSTNALVGTLTDPGGAQQGQEFGRQVAWVGGKIAVSEPNAVSGNLGKVFIFDNVSDPSPLEIDDPYNSFGGFGLSMAPYGNDLLVVSQSAGGGNGNGSINRFDINDGHTVKVYTDNFALRDDHLGNTLAVDGTHIYATSWRFNDLNDPNFEQVVDEFDGEGAGNQVLHTIHENPVDPQLAQNDFGTAIAATASTVLISAPGEDVVYELDKSTLAELRQYTVPQFDGQDGSHEFHFIGSSIVVSGNKVLIGDPRSFKTMPVQVGPDTVDQNVSEGDAHVFDLTTGNLLATIDNPTPQADPGQGSPDSFGAPVAALPDGKFLIADITEDVDNQVLFDTGAVFVFAPDVTNQPPTAHIAPVAAVDENSTVTLDASGSTDPDGQADIVSYSWDLNNDSVYGDASGETIPFTQDLPGTYPVSVKVTDSAGHESTDSINVTFNDVAPTANAGGDQTASEGTGVTLNGSGGSTTDGPVTYAWDFDGDGFDDGNTASTAFNPDLPGDYTVRLRVTDNDNQSTDSSAIIHITDVAPTANANGPYNVAEGSGLTLHGTGTSAPGDTIPTYQWDLDNNGVFETTGQDIVINTDLPRSFTVGFRVVDDDNQVSAATTTTVTITNVAPTANAGGNQTGSEGTGVTLHGSGSNTSGDAIVGYAWDLDNNGSFETAGQNVAFNPDLPGNYTVKLQVTDDDGETAVDSAVITITNVGPTANAGANQIGVAYQSLNFTGSGTSAPGDAITYEWDFNYNGTTFNSAASGASVSHAYTATGIYTVALRVTDDDGQQAISQLTVNVNKSNVVGGTLFFGGTSVKDTITISKATGGVNVDSQDTNKTVYAPVSRVVIFGGDGDDSIKSNSDVPVSLEIYGGAGKDTIVGGLGNDILVGGDGNDQIQGNDGADIAIGSAGSDTVTTNNGDDILIAGYTLLDNDPASLRAIQAEWTSGHTYTDRVNNIRNGTGLNGSVKLQADVNVFDDGVADTLTGNNGVDWYFANTDLGIRDKLDARAGETVTDIDVVIP